MYCEKNGLGFIDKHKDDHTHKKAYNFCDLYMPPLYLSCVLWEEVLRFANVGISSAHSSNKLLLIDLPLLHVVVELLLLIL